MREITADQKAGILSIEGDVLSSDISNLLDKVAEFFKSRKGILDDSVFVEFRLGTVITTAVSRIGGFICLLEDIFGGAGAEEVFWLSGISLGVIFRFMMSAECSRDNSQTN